MTRLPVDRREAIVTGGAEYVRFLNSELKKTPSDPQLPVSVGSLWTVFDTWAYQLFSLNLVRRAWVAFEGAFSRSAATHGSA